jgi:hypothetical protein
MNNLIPRTWPSLVGRIGAVSAIIGALVYGMSPPDARTAVTTGQVVVKSLGVV